MRKCAQRGATRVDVLDVSRARLALAPVPMARGDHGPVGLDHRGEELRIGRVAPIGARDDHGLWNGETRATRQLER